MLRSVGGDPPGSLHILLKLFPPYARRWIRTSTDDRYQEPGYGEKEQPKIRPASCLDGLRGFAALIVFIFHTCWAYVEFVEYGYGLSPYDYRILQLPFVRLLYAGHAMVSVFFVVGGYVIALKPLKLMRAHAWNELHVTMSSSIFRRGIRIYAPVIIATFISAMTLHFGLWEYPRRFIFNRELINYADIHPDPAPTLGLQLYDWFYQSVGMTNVWSYYNSGFMMPYYNSYDPHLWTVAFEMRSSIVVAFTLLALSRCRESVRMVIVAGLVVFCCYWDRWECMLFLSGALIAELDMNHETPQQRHQQPREAEQQSPPSSPQFPLCDRNHSKRSISQRLCSMSPYLLFVASLYLLSAPNLRVPDAPGYNFLMYFKPRPISDDKRFLQGVGAVLLTASLTNSPLLQRPFLTPLAQYLGKISYSLYIVHGTLNHIVGLAVTPSVMVALGAGADTPVRWAAGFLVGNCAYAVVVLWVADLFQRGVDRNCVRLAKVLEEVCFSRD